MKIAITFLLLSAVSFAQNTPAVNDGNQLFKTCGSLVNDMKIPSAPYTPLPV